MNRTFASVLIIALAALALRVQAADDHATIPTAPLGSPTAIIPLGDVPGDPQFRAKLSAKAVNPYEGQAAAVQNGKMLYQKMNCVYCHQFDGSGLIGPSLINGQWRYGGRPAEIFQSIFAGRPQGMPAWGEGLPDDRIWQIVTYIESLGGTIAQSVASEGDVPARPPTSTENPTVDTEQVPTK